MTDNEQHHGPDGDYGSGFGGWITFTVLLVLLILFWPVLTGLLNSALYPGYQTCKREIAKVLRDPDNADYEWPPRRFSHRTHSDIWRWVISIRSTNGYGGKSSKVIGCTVDSSGSEPRYILD